jgi:hypothetical protein
MVAENLAALHDLASEVRHVALLSRSAKKKADVKRIPKDRSTSAYSLTSRPHRAALHLVIQLCSEEYTRCRPERNEDFGKQWKKPPRTAPRLHGVGRSIGGANASGKAGLVADMSLTDSVSGTTKGASHLKQVTRVPAAASGTCIVPKQLGHAMERDMATGLDGVN